MTFRGLLARVFFVAALCASGPVWAAPDKHSADASLYKEALLFMAEGRYEEASEMLQRLVSQEPEHAGAWLDIAILHCSMGSARNAEAIFDRIEKRFSPPPAVLEVIAQQRARGCQAQKPEAFGRLRLGRGYDGNVNQGASNPNFSIGSGNTLVNLVLSPDYAPKKDAFTALSAEFAQALSVGGTLGFMQLQARQYDSLSRFNLASLVVGAEHPWRLGAWGLRGTGSVGLTTFGGALYQRQGQLQLQVTPPLALPTGWELAMVGGRTGVTYPTLSGFDSQLWESRGLLTYRTENAFAQASAGYAFDKGAGQRPGNNRSGVVASLSGRMRLSGDSFGELSWSHQSWNGQQAYSPGLIDQRRRQNTRLLRAAFIFPIAPQQSLQVELRDVRNRENISLFEYAGRLLQVSWQWQTGP